jgi:hypothetical protein
MLQIQTNEKITIKEIGEMMELYWSTAEKYVGKPDYPADKTYNRNRVLKILKSLESTCQICGKKFINSSKRFKNCKACREEKKKKILNTCYSCGKKFYAYKKYTTCFSCGKVTKKDDPYGVMIKPQYRGRKCVCGAPLPTGVYRCGKCKISLENFNEDFLVY